MPPFKGSVAFGVPLAQRTSDPPSFRDAWTHRQPFARPSRVWILLSAAPTTASPPSAPASGAPDASSPRARASFSERLAQLPRSAWVLVGVNVAPILGVVALGWRLGDLLLLYWLESAVVGFYNIGKMLSLKSWANLFHVPFFVIHYGGFMAGHLVFLGALLLPMSGTSIGEGLRATWPAGILLVLSHGVSFWTNFILGGERTRTTLDKLFATPYARIVIMHVAILFGALAALALGTPLAVLVLLVALKTTVDLWAHVRERKRAGRDRPA